MIPAVIHEARLREVQEDGKTRWVDHLRRLVERGHRPESDLIGPPIPEPLEYLWTWLLELDRMRDVGMNGTKPFTPQMVEAWCRLTDREITPSEFGALMTLGRLLKYPPKEEFDG